jgi:hypothetical protein
VAQETLGEEEILQVTGLPRARPLETGKLPAESDTQPARRLR